MIRRASLLVLLAGVIAVGSAVALTRYLRRR